MTASATPDDRELALAPLDEKVDHVRGAPAGHLIIEYGDYECPYSRQAFHALGAPKYAALGLDYPCGAVVPPGAEQLEEVRGAFAAAGLRAI